MSPTLKETIHANGIDISVYTNDFKNEFISLTDIARYRSSDPRITIHSWLRSRDIVEFLGLWESLHNPDFKRTEFDTFKKDAGTNANLESYNAILIEQNLSQRKRLELLRETAEKQLRTILGLDFGTQKILSGPDNKDE